MKLKHPDIADQYDYYYVPTYYLDGIKFHEGIPEQKDGGGFVQAGIRRMM
jgi:hypothetical protein